ncbi:MAG: hypothetical protein QM607_03490, partial [Microbacterium sp.]
MNRTIRTGAAMIGVAGAFALAGCGAVTVGSTDDGVDTESTAEATSSADTSTATSTVTPTESADTEATGEADEADSDYTDGTYTADGSYTNPHGDIESVTVTVTLEDDIVTDVTVESGANDSESEKYQESFIDGIADQVVGVD